MAPTKSLLHDRFDMQRIINTIDDFGGIAAVQRAHCTYENKRKKYSKSNSCDPPPYHLAPMWSAHIRRAGPDSKECPVLGQLHAHVTGPEGMFADELIDKVPASAIENDELAGGCYTCQLAMESWVESSGKSMEPLRVAGRSRGCH